MKGVKIYTSQKVSLKKYDEVKALKRRLAKALSIQSDKIDVLKDKNRLIISQTA